MRLYVAGPITDPDMTVVRQRCEDACRAGMKLVELGHYAYVPHWSGLLPESFDIPHERWLKQDMEWLRLCDGIVLLPGWERSKGAKMELAEAEQLGLTVFFYLEDAPWIKARTQR